MDINKFVQRSKRNTCISNALFMSHSCKGTSRINLETDVITRLNQHNHGIEDYNTDVYELKTECKNNTKNSKRNIRKVFDDRTRMDPHACEISFSLLFLANSHNSGRSLICRKAHFTCNSLPNEAKSQELYQAVLEKLREKNPHFQPQVAMSDWEHA